MLKVKQDDASRIIEIEGIRYAYEFFKGLGQCGFTLHTPFVILERNDGVITVEVVPHEGNDDEEKEET